VPKNKICGTQFVHKGFVLYLVCFGHNPKLRETACSQVIHPDKAKFTGAQIILTSQNCWAALRMSDPEKRDLPDLGPSTYLKKNQMERAGMYTVKKP
jgi:hypothetical protein